MTQQRGVTTVLLIGILLRWPESSYDEKVIWLAAHMVSVNA